MMTNFSRYIGGTRGLIGLGLLGAAAATVAWAVPLTGSQKPREGYALMRLRTIEAQAEQITGDYILLAGDSHIERLYLPTLCGLPTLNAGLSGATTREVSTLLSAAKLRPPRLTILTVGTNDANLKRNPKGDEASVRFRQDLENLLSVALWRSTSVVVSQIPPLRDGTSAGFSPAAITAFDAIADDICTARKCLHAALFPNAGAGNGTSNWERPLHAADGVHISRLADRINSHEREICEHARLEQNRIEQ